MHPRTRRARPDRRAPARTRGGRQHAGLGRDGGARAAGLPAACAGASRRRSADAEYRDLVVRAEGRARGSAARLDEFAIEGAYGRGVPGFGSGPILAGELSASERDGCRTRSRIAASTMSARNWCGCRPRRCGRMAGSRRVRSCCGCSRRRRPRAGPSCPAASAGLPSEPDARAVSMGDGARSADVWVVSDKAVSAATLLPAADTVRDPAHRRRGAEPRRRQSVLARPLSRARRGDAAADPRARHAEREPRRDLRPRCRRSSGCSGCW